jgi:hypothetical protein
MWMRGGREQQKRERERGLAASRKIQQQEWGVNYLQGNFLERKREKNNEEGGKKEGKERIMIMSVCWLLVARLVRKGQTWNRTRTKMMMMKKQQQKELKLN